MKPLKVADLMTDEVVFVAPGTAFKEDRLVGIGTLDGHVELRSQLPALLSLAERLDGVVAVASHVTDRTDGTDTTHAAGARQTMPW
ncbi:hypothetical protein OG311_02915 [Streptomyces sp. NBC_01343]|uniref:hypothetical protein n=1 Tax=Streptomyces sp. NBC_01343 TaxID=2903832 RepID=UPI002E166E8B|nr:hypothetical protein OG311_02915 [Streptomyces sp. NBC_01343]